MRKIKKLLMTFGIAGALAIGVGATVATQNSNPDKVNAAANKEVLTFTMNASSISGSPTTLEAKEDATKTLAVNYTGLDDKKTYMMFNENLGFAYSSSAIDGYYVSSITTSYTGQTSTSGLVDHIYSNTQTTTRKNPCKTKVSRNGKTSTTNDDATKTFWNVSTSKKNVQIANLVVTYHVIPQSKGEPTGVEITNGETLEITSGYLDEKISTQLLANVTYASGDSDSKAKWSTDSSIATVTEDGWMTFKENGSATFTATAGNFSDTIVVTASGLQVNLNKSATIATFDTNSGALDAIISYTAVQGGGTNAPAPKTSELRLYKPSDGNTTGNELSITSEDGYAITSVTITGSLDTMYFTDGVTTKNVKSSSLVSPYEITVSNLDTSLVTFANISSSERYDLFSITVKYTPVIIKDVASVNLSLASDASATYFNTGRTSNGILSTDNLVLTTVDADGNNIKNLTLGTGYKVKAALNGAEKAVLDATSTVQELNFENYEPGLYTLTAEFVKTDGNVLTSNSINVTVQANSTKEVNITKATSKVEYKAYLDAYVPFDGTLKAIFADGEYTSSLSNFRFEYVDGQNITEEPVLNSNNCFETNTTKTITVNIYETKYNSDVFATYDITVYALTGLSALDANETTYYAGEDYTPSASVTGMYNGVKYGLPTSAYTFEPATINFETAGTHQVTVRSAFDPTIATTYDITVEPARAKPTAIALKDTSFTFDVKGNFRLTPDASGIYGDVTLDNGQTKAINLDTDFTYAISTTTNPDDAKPLAKDTMLKMADNGKYIFVYYTANNKTVLANGAPFKVTMQNPLVLPEFTDTIIGTKYVKVTDVSQLHDGDQIVFKIDITKDNATTTTHISDGLNSKSKYLTDKVTVLANDGSINKSEVITPLTIKKAGLSWKLYLGDKLLGCTSGKDLRIAKSDDADAIWNFNTVDTKVLLKNNNYTSQFFAYNINNPRFKPYDSANATIVEPEIYRLDTTWGTEPAQYIKDVIDAMRLNSPTFVEGEGNSICELLNDVKNADIWNNIKKSFKANKDNKDFIAALNVVDTYSDGLSTYLLTVQHLMALDPAESVNLVSGAIVDDTGIIISIVAIALLGVTSIAAFAVLSKRKVRHN